MRKELVWVALIGIAIGLIIAFGIYRINSSIKSKITSSGKTPEPASLSSEFKITLDKPENGDVLTQDSVTVSGITKALTWLTFSGETGDYIVQSDENGIFSQDVDLSPGVNQIKVTTFDPQGGESSSKVLVVYSSAFQEKAAGTPVPESASGESAIRDKVAQKVAEALNRPKAYIGVVTDITDSTIQIKTTEAEIKQISVAGEDIAVINSKTSSGKVVKLTDIAIGDFIVAMGYINSNSVLLAQRILIINPVTEPKLSVAIAKVTNAGKKALDVSALKTGEASTLTPDTKTFFESFLNGKLTKMKLADISQGDLIIYVTLEGEKSTSTRSIFVVARSQS